jgi:hypothetical protein
MHGILTSTANKYFHSTQAAGINHTPIPPIDVLMGSDTYLNMFQPTTNNGNSQIWAVGDDNSGIGVKRTWIKPDFSNIPAGRTFLTAILNITPTGDLSSNARTMYAHRCLRDVNELQATWNIWKTSNNWGTAGCSNSTTDYDGAVTLGTMTQPASPTLNTALQMTLSASEIQKLYDGTYTNNGIILFVDTQNTDAIIYASSTDATSAYRPFITITFE